MLEPAFERDFELLFDFSGISAADVTELASGISMFSFEPSIVYLVGICIYIVAILVSPIFVCF